jgi:Holliday junction resolvasome RuvABC endonuclease subunit
VKILGLDISTKTGYAVIQDGVLIKCGLKQVPPLDIVNLAEDFSILHRAKSMADLIELIVTEHRPDQILIEQTNLGRNRTDQKKLEFIHCMVLDKLTDLGVAHVVSYVDTSQWRSLLQIKLSKEQRAHNKAVKGGEARGKVTPKHLAVAWANDKYKLTLLKKDHDIADAIALATLGHERLTQPVPAHLIKTVEEILLNPTK